MVSKRPEAPKIPAQSQIPSSAGIYHFRRDYGPKVVTMDTKAGVGVLRAQVGALRGPVGASLGAGGCKTLARTTKPQVTCTWGKGTACLEGCAVVERDGDCAVGVDGGVVDEGSPGFRRVADCGVLTTVLVERGNGRTLGFELA